MTFWFTFNLPNHFGSKLNIFSFFWMSVIIPLKIGFTPTSWNLCSSLWLSLFHMMFWYLTGSQNFQKFVEIMPFNYIYTYIVSLVSGCISFFSGVKYDYNIYQYSFCTIWVPIYFSYFSQFFIVVAVNIFLTHVLDTHTHTHIHTHPCTHTYMHTYMCVCVCIYIYTYIHIYIYMCVCVCVWNEEGEWALGEGIVPSHWLLWIWLIACCEVRGCQDNCLFFYCIRKWWNCLLLIHLDMYISAIYSF